MSYRDHMILDACLNTTGDAMMLCLPIPLLVKARLPLNRFVQPPVAHNFCDDSN